MTGSSIFADLVRDRQRPLRRGEEWPEQGVRFRTRRGSFSLPKALRDEPDEWARSFARHLPSEAEQAGGTLSISSRVEGKLEVFTWRIIKVVPA
jgi:hypothetical protein